MDCGSGFFEQFRVMVNHHHNFKRWEFLLLN